MTVYFSRSLALSLSLSLWLCALPAEAAVPPQLFNSQGRIAVDGVNFAGTGYFKFALVNGTGTVTHWSNDGTSVAGSQPLAAVPLSVTKGLYSVLLGDTSLANMASLGLSSAIFETGDLRLRVWFNDGTHGFQLITPDQRLAAVPYAAMATVASTATNFSGELAGEVTGQQGVTAISAAAVTGKPLTGYASGAGVVSSSDSILTAINKLNGNGALKADLASPAFTGTVSGITAAMVGLSNVSNTADASKPVSTAQQTALDLKANLVSPAFTGTVSGITAAMVGLGNVSNTADASKPVSTAQQTALDLKANLASPTFTGTTSGTFSGPLTGNVTGNVTGSAASFTSLLAGDVTGTQGATAISAATVTGKALTGYVSGAGTVSAADSILTAIDKLNGNDALKAPLASPTFTGTVGGITALMVGLGNVSNTADASKPVSAAQQTALDLKANLASPTFSGTVLLPTGTAIAAPLQLAPGTNLTTPVFGAVEFDGTNLFLTNSSSAPARKTVAFTEAPIFTGVPLAPTASAGNTTTQIATTQFVQSAIQSVVGAAPAALDTLHELAVALDDGTSYAATIISTLALKAPLASPSFTGTISGTFSGPLTGNVTGNVTGSAASFAGSLAGDVTGTQSATAISPATVTGKALTGYVSGAGTLSATDSILTAINKLNGNDALKANVASPAFTGTVLLPAGSSASAPLQLAVGTNLATPVVGSVEFDGTNLYLTTNAATPSRKAVVLSDSGSNAPVSLSSVVAAPLKPVVAWGENTSGQATVPSLANVANIACGSSHSLALLDNGTVLAWGLNSKGQTVVPASATGITEIAAGAKHNLVRKSDGTLLAWGDDASGQCTIPANINTATKVAAGANHSLALLADGSLRAWGDNYWGQTTIPASLSGVTVTAIAAGYDHSLALTAAGAVVAWGRGSEVDGLGQSSVPAGAASGVVAIAAGAYHSLALQSNGTVVAWGWDVAGQVTDPASWSGIIKIAGGYGFSLGLKSDGTLVGGGDTTKGQAAFPADATKVTAIAAGENHALALRSDSIPAPVALLDKDNVFSGKVGIKRTPAANALEVEGNASKTTASNWLANSDRRIKTDIAPITGALDKLAQVRLVDFRYTPEYRAAHPVIEDRRYPNVIAQEFAEVFPDQVQESGELMADGSPILQVDTYPLTIYTAAAVQELQRSQQNLQAENAQLKERLQQQEALQQQQEARLQRLEALLAK